MASTKKIGAAVVIRSIAAVLGVIGLAVVLVCNAKGGQCAFAGLFGYVLGAALAIVFAGLSVWAPGHEWERGLVGPACNIAGVIAFVLTAINMFAERILLVSGLFTWDSMNTMGWTAFYLTAAAAICFVAAALFLVIGAFFAPKQVEQA